VIIHIYIVYINLYTVAYSLFFFLFSVVDMGGMKVRLCLADSC